MTQDQYNSAVAQNTQDSFDMDEEDLEYDPDEDELAGVAALAHQGHKFGLPDLPLPPGSNLRKRYDTLVDQVTKLLMRDGKLSVAQRVRPTTQHTPRPPQSIRVPAQHIC